MGKKKSLEGNEAKTAWTLLIPTLVVIFAIAFFPLVSVFVDSMTDREIASEKEINFVGFENYINLLSMTIRELPPKVDEDTGEIVMNEETGEIEYTSPVRVLPREPRRYKELSVFDMFGKKYVLGATDAEFLASVRDTIFFVIVSVFFETIIGLAVALVLNANFKGRGPMRAVMLIPWAIPTAVSSRMWEYMFYSTRAGFFNTLGEFLGLSSGQFAFIAEPGAQLWVMIAIDTWKTIPFMALLLLAGLQLIDKGLYEAAVVDGANVLRRFWHITLPLLKPTLTVALVFRTMDSLRVFDLFQIVFGEKRFSMASFTYYELISNNQMGYSAASSVIIFFILLIFVLLYVKTVGVGGEHA
jgi:trehalose/maltose transport system permease protein